MASAWIFALWYCDLDVGGVRLLLQQFVVQSDLQAHEICFGGLQVERGVDQRLLHFLVTQFEDHRLGRQNRRARKRHDAIDGGVGARREPADVFRHQRAGPAHLAQHLAALDGVAPRGATFHGRRGGTQLREDDGDECDYKQVTTENAIRFSFFSWRLPVNGHIHAVSISPLWRQVMAPDA